MTVVASIEAQDFSFPREPQALSLIDRLGLLPQSAGSRRKAFSLIYDVPPFEAPVLPSYNRTVVTNFVSFCDSLPPCPTKDDRRRSTSLSFRAVRLCLEPALTHSTQILFLIAYLSPEMTSYEVAFS